MYFLLKFVYSCLLAIYIFLSISSHFLCQYLFTNTVIFFSVLYKWYSDAYFLLHIPCDTFLSYEIVDIYFQYLSWGMCLEILCKELSLIFVFFHKPNGTWWFIYRDIFLFLFIYGFVYSSLGPFLWPPWFPYSSSPCVFIVHKKR